MWHAAAAAPAASAPSPHPPAPVYTILSLCGRVQLGGVGAVLGGQRIDLVKVGHRLGVVHAVAACHLSRKLLPRLQHVMIQDDVLPGCPARKPYFQLLLGSTLLKPPEHDVLCIMSYQHHAEPRCCSASSDGMPYTQRGGLRVCRATQIPSRALQGSSMYDYILTAALLACHAAHVAAKP